jgi:hypothetical protein
MVKNACEIDTKSIISKKQPKKEPTTRKYIRTKWSTLQLTILMILFLENKFPDIEEISSIACILDTNVRQVKVWFQNTRQRPMNIERLLLTL